MTQFLSSHFCCHYRHLHIHTLEFTSLAFVTGSKGTTWFGSCTRFFVMWSLLIFLAMHFFLWEELRRFISVLVTGKHLWWVLCWSLHHKWLQWMMSQGNSLSASEQGSVSLALLKTCQASSVLLVLWVVWGPLYLPAHLLTNVACFFIQEFIPERSLKPKDSLPISYTLLCTIILTFFLLHFTYSCYYSSRIFFFSFFTGCSFLPFSYFSGWIFSYIYCIEGGGSITC